MPQTGSADDARRRSLADLSILDAGGEGDPQSSFSVDPTRYPTLAAPLPRNGGLFGSGWAQFLADRLRGGASASPPQGYTLGTPETAKASRDGPPANTQISNFRPRQVSPPSGAGAPVAAPGAPTSDRTPLDAAQSALRNFQNGPKIPRPNLVESFIPVVGPAWEAAGDVQDRNYRAAALNGALALADVVPVGVVGKGLEAASKGVGILKKGSVTAGAAAKQLRRLGVAKAGEEIHHTVALNGIGRSEQNWRNHYAFLKVLPQEVHRRLHGSWHGKPMYDPVRRLWYGTTDWMKAAPVAATRVGAGIWEHVSDPFSDPPPASPPKPSR